MPKANKSKSSASSGTRKKHARKAAGDDSEAPSKHKSNNKGPGKTKKGGLTKKEARQKEKEIRQKSYVAPTKPAPVRPDPLDSTGLAHRLPPELVIVLRNLGKKAVVTRGRALEELQASWVGDEKEDVLRDMLPVWLHHLPQLLIHPSRRIRHLTVTLHRSLLAIPSISHQILYSLTELLDEDQTSAILGTWALAVHDIDRGVTGIATQSWEPFVQSLVAANEGGRIPSTYMSSIIAFAQRAIFDPMGLYSYLNPAPPTTIPPSSISQPSGSRTARHGTANVAKNQNAKQRQGHTGKPGGPSPGTPTRQQPRNAPNPVQDPSASLSSTVGTRSDDTESLESDPDRAARIRVGGIGVVRWVVEWLVTHPDADAGKKKKEESNAEDEAKDTETREKLFAILSNPVLWSALYHTSTCPFVPNSEGANGTFFEAFGASQPAVRKAAWGLVGSLVSSLSTLKASPTTDSSHIEESKVHPVHNLQLRRVLSAAVLLSAFSEPDPGVQGVMWQPLLRFLKENPDAWTLEMEYTHFLGSVSRSSASASAHADDVHHSDDDEDGSGSEGSEDGDSGDSEAEAGAEDDEPRAVDKVKQSTATAAAMATSKVPRTSAAYEFFLQFLRAGCNGSPVQSYPAVVVILSTIPTGILLYGTSRSAPSTLTSYSPNSSTATPPPPFADLFEAFWGALSSLSSSTPSSTAMPNAFSGVHRTAAAASKAFLEAVLECLVFLVRRIGAAKAYDPDSEQAPVSDLDLDSLGLLVREQIDRVWEGATPTVPSENEGNGEDEDKAKVRARGLRLRVKPDVLGAGLVRLLSGLRRVDVEAETKNFEANGSNGAGHESGRSASGLYQNAWEMIRQLVSEATASLTRSGADTAESNATDQNTKYKEMRELASLVPSVLKAFVDNDSSTTTSSLPTTAPATSSGSTSTSSSSPSSSAADELLYEVLNLALGGCERESSLPSSLETGSESRSGSEIGSAGSIMLLVELIRSFGVELFDKGGGEGGDAAKGESRGGIIKRIDTLVVRNALGLLMTGDLGLELLEMYLRHRDGDFSAVTSAATIIHDHQASTQTSLLWLALLEQIAHQYEHEYESSSGGSGFERTLGRLLRLLESLKDRDRVRATLRPTNELDALIQGVVRRVIAGQVQERESVSVSLMQTVLRNPLPILSPGALSEVVRDCVGAFVDKIEGQEGMMYSDKGAGAGNGEGDGNKERGENLEVLLSLLDVILGSPACLHAHAQHLQSASSSPSTSTSVPTSTSASNVEETQTLVNVALPLIFVVAHVLPQCYDDVGDVEQSFTHAKRIWDTSLRSIAVQDRTDVVSAVVRKLKGLIVHTGVRCLPRHVITAFQILRDSIGSGVSGEGLDLDPIRALLPPQAQLDSMLDRLTAQPISPSLAVLDHLALLVPPASELPSPSSSTGVHDMLDFRGYSSYARLVSALLCCISDDLRVVRNESNLWMLRHLWALSVFAEDVVNVPFGGRSEVFNSQRDVTNRTAIDTIGLKKEIVDKVQQITSYVFTSSSMTQSENESTGWRRQVCQSLTTDKSSPTTLPPLGHFLLHTISSATNSDSYRDCRILRELLERVFRMGLGGQGQELQEEEADKWILYARKIERVAPLVCMTIVSTATRHLPSFPRLDRYRNELAASLLGVKHADGLMILRKLSATAPDMEGEAEFLPPQRAVNVVKACQKWIEEEEGEDDDEDEVGTEEIESAMTWTFFHLSPILQNVPGGHWAFMFDVIENNIENCNSITTESEPTQLVTLARTLRLIALIQDLASTNKSLRADWGERRGSIFSAVKDLLTSTTDSPKSSSWSAPASVCRELALSLAADHLPDNLIDHETLPKMCHLLSSSPSIPHQQMSYQILHQAATKRTEHFVLEAGVDTEGKIRAELPRELMVLLEQSLNLDLWDVDADTENGGMSVEQEQSVFVHLLGWMLLFDLFKDTSMKVRMSYMEQLRASAVFEKYFIPNIFGLLGMDRGIVKTFKLDMWVVDEFYVQFYELGSLSGLQVLAAHLYYRGLLTVPSLIYSWVLECRDRQLSSTIATYTSSHFSPVLIRTELDHVKSPEASAELADENLTVKVAPAVNEVIATYLVDEQNLEIRLRIPVDWPLHRIEIKDVKKVGVDDNRWRAWLLAVQQTIWAQNGRILDGLALFKKNVTGHFEGQVECAICYSIISVMDGSLPKKPCNTCKNRFHAGCLYKWFNSSHSSSCPLCRSDILH